MALITIEVQRVGRSRQLWLKDSAGIIGIDSAMETDVTTGDTVTWVKLKDAKGKDISGIDKFHGIRWTYEKDNIDLASNNGDEISVKITSVVAGEYNYEVGYCADGSSVITWEDPKLRLKI